MNNKILRTLLMCLSLAAAAQTASAQCPAPLGGSFSVGTGRGLFDIAVGDFDGDGRADIAAPDSNSDKIFILSGTASGVPSVTTLTSVLGPEQIAAADFNRDGKLDLVVTHGAQGGARFVSVHLGDGAGGFAAPNSFPAQQSRPLVVADFNKDANPDLFLGNTSTNVSQVLLGNGAGGFGAGVNVVVPNNGSASAGDFNSDGNVDLVVANDGQFIGLALGDGAGGFNPSAFFFAVQRASFVAAADLNGDGKLDVVTTGQDDGVSVLLGNGAGNFGGAASYATGFQGRGAAVGDFDEDGKPDIFVAGTVGAALLKGDGAGAFTLSGRFPVSQQPLEVALGDFDGDGDLDAATADNWNPGLPPLDGSFQNDTVTFFLGDGAGHVASASLLDTPSNAFDITSGDLDGDGDDDLVFLGVNTQNVWVRLSDGAGGFLPAVGIPAGAQPSSAAVGDVNGDGRPDLVTSNASAGTVSLIHGDGAGNFAAPAQLAVPGNTPNHITLGDFNGDGLVDLAVSYFNSSFVSVLRADGAGGFFTAVNSNAPSSSQHAVAHDFNDDGHSDLALAVIGAVAVLPGNGAGGFGPANNLTVELVGGVSSVAASDFNSDGKADLAAVGPNRDSVAVFLGDGAGAFSSPSYHATGDGPDALAVADIDGDTNPDLVTANSAGTVSLLRGDGAGGFLPAFHYAVTSVTAPGGVTLGDFDSDNRPDVATANRGGNLIGGGGNNPGTLSTLLNTCGAPPAQLPSLSVGDIVAAEGDTLTTQATFTVTLSAASAKTVAASIYAAPRDAARGSDFQPAAGRVTFAPGETTKTFSVSVLGDPIDEFDEKFAVLLAHPLNATVADGLALATITDDDLPPRVSIADAAVFEGNSSSTTINFTVALFVVSGKPVSVNFATQSGTAASSGPNPDFAATTGTLDFQPGQATMSVSVTVVGDSVAEPDESFFVNISSPANAVIAREQAVGTILNDDTNIQLDTDAVTVSESAGVALVRVTRTGVLSAAHLVTYATNDITASERTDYTLATGTLNFAPGETFKDIPVFITDDALVEGPETFRLDLLAFSPGTQGTPTRATVTVTSDDATAGPNPIDTDTGFFVRQHYRDFLGRDADAGGLQFWTNEIESCGADLQCREIKRINVSAAFFLSIEFQQSGYLVHRLHQAAFNSGEHILLRHFAADMGAIRDGVVVGVGDWAQRLEANKRAFVEEFVRRPEFLQRFPETMTAQQFVDGLNANTFDPLDPSAGGSLTPQERDQLADALATGAMTRAEVLRAVAEHQTFHRRHFNKAFVLMQYFGYLRREPDQGGYDFWLSKLNDFGGNFINAEMVKAFITSLEYRARFGPL